MSYNYIFPTCIWSDDQYDMSQKLLPIAESYLNKYGETFQTNPNHISTYRNMDMQPIIKADPNFDALRDYIINHSKEYIKKQNINLDPFEDKLHDILFLVNKITKTGNHPVHAHANSILSGCFYLKCNENDPPIIFSDPRSYFKHYFYQYRHYDDNNINTLTPDFCVPVKPGLIMIWPSWLDHLVPPSHNDSDRISIAFNIGRI